MATAVELLAAMAHGATAVAREEAILLTGCDVIVCWRHNWPGCPRHSPDWMKASAPSAE